MPIVNKRLFHNYLIKVWFLNRKKIQSMNFIALMRLSLIYKNIAFSTFIHFNYLNRQNLDLQFACESFKVVFSPVYNLFWFYFKSHINNPVYFRVRTKSFVRIVILHCSECGN